MWRPRPRCRQRTRRPSSPALALDLARPDSGLPRPWPCRTPSRRPCRCPPSPCPPWRCRAWRFGLGGVGLPGPAAALGRGRRGVVLGRVLQGRREAHLLVRRWLLGTQGAFRARLALELLPVACDLENGHDRLGGLRAHGKPVLRPLRVDLDERRLFLRVVLADLLDGTPVALGPGVGDDDPVGRHPGPAQALELDLYSHGCGLLPANKGTGGGPAARWGLAGPLEWPGARR